MLILCIGINATQFVENLQTHSLFFSPEWTLKKRVNSTEENVHIFFRSIKHYRSTFIAASLVSFNVCLLGGAFTLCFHLIIFDCVLLARRWSNDSICPHSALEQNASRHLFKSITGLLHPWQTNTRIDIIITPGRRTSTCTRIFTREWERVRGARGVIRSLIGCWQRSGCHGLSPH